MIAPEFLYAVVVVMIAAFLSLLRVFLGPSVPDRVVGVDTLNTLIVAGWYSSAPPTTGRYTST